MSEGVQTQIMPLKKFRYELSKPKGDKFIHFQFLGVYIIYDISKPKDRNFISIPNLGTSAKYGYILTKLIDIPYSEA